MKAVSRSAYPGAAVFAGAAGLAGMLAIALWFPLRPDHHLGVWLWSVAKAGTAAGVSAGLSFAILNRMGWRLRLGSPRARAVVLGASTVLGAHLLIGPVSALLMLAEGAVISDLSFDLSTVATLSFFVCLFSVMFVLVTVPLGIAASLLVESLEDRMRLESSDQAKAAE